MKPLSVVIITFNEEKNIERCLKSITDIADEIVVVDSLSTDRTKEICEKYNATFIQQPFLGYIEQKNFAFSKASHDFVLSMDADECLNETLTKHILEEKQKGFTSDGYTMNRCTNFCGKWIRHGTWYPDTKLRLLNKQKGKWGGTNPHDYIVMQANTSTKHLKGDILHYSYYSIAEVATQNNKFTEIQAQAMFEKGRRATALNFILNPLSAFVNGYIFKAGFLDGLAGFFIACSVSYYTLVKYVKLWYLQKKN
jgi:glycosyltransferase involved in cell wall biosynthesis